MFRLALCRESSKVSSERRQRRASSEEAGSGRVTGSLADRECPVSHSGNWTSQAEEWGQPADPKAAHAAQAEQAAADSHRAQLLVCWQSASLLMSFRQDQVARLANSGDNLLVGLPVW